jgi:capsular exopolysaccharide synthesis family protein
VDVAEHFRTILQNWWRILVVSALIAATVYVADASRAKQYAATAELQVTSGRASVGQASNDDTNFLTATYSTLGKTAPVVATAVAKSGLKLDTGTAGRRISVGQENNTGFLKVRATGPSPADAAALARGESQALTDAVRNQQDAAKNADLADLLAAMAKAERDLATLPPTSPQITALQQSLQAATTARYAREAQPSNRIDVVSPAVAGSSPVAPKPLRDSLLALAVAFVIVSELWVVVRAVGDRFSATDDSADIMKLAGLPVLARIPKGSDADTVEAFRILRTNLMFLEGAGKPRTLAVVSANPDAGKTFVAIHLAESAAALDEKVVLIDADLRKPAVHERLGVVRAPGLSAVLQGADISSTLRRNSSSPFLRILPSGAPVSDPSGVLGARAFRQVLDGLRAVRLVVVDTPPGALFADAMAVASQCDATIFVLDMKTSRKRAVRATIDSLERGGANIVGLVVNRAATPRQTSYYGN